MFLYKNENNYSMIIAFYCTFGEIFFLLQYAKYPLNTMLHAILYEIQINHNDFNKS